MKVTRDATPSDHLLRAYCSVFERTPEPLVILGEDGEALVINRAALDRKILDAP